MAFAKLTFTERLVRLREQKALSQRDMAKRLGISPAYLNDTEQGNRGPSVRLVARVCDEFGFGPYLRLVWNLAAARAHGWEV